jgi:hypothetical protein
MTTLWEGLPRMVPARLAVLRAAFTDGAYLRAWPAAGVAVPVLALAAGAVCGWRPWAESARTDVTYTSSITIMVVLAVFGFAGAANGIWCLAGYVLADLLLHDHLPRFYRGSYLMNVLTTYLPLLLAYLLLAALIVLIPCCRRGWAGNWWRGWGGTRCSRPPPARWSRRCSCGRGPTPCPP